MTKRPTGELPSGWCMTGYHDECRDFYMKQPYARECPCSCKHLDKKVEVKVA